MGCSSSRDVRGDIEMPAVRASPPAESRAASALASLGLCRGRHHSVHAYSPLPLEETVKCGAAGSPGEEAPAWSAEGPRHASRAPTRSPACGKRGLLEVLEDAVSATSSRAHWPASATSSTAQWPASPSGSVGESSTPLPVQFDLDPATMSGFRQILVGPSPSHPSLLYPEKEAQSPRTSAARDVPEVTGLVRARVDEFHRKLEEKKKLKEQPGEGPVDVTGEVKPPRRRTGKAVVVYFTSLRGVRRTFEDGRAVRDILRSYRVRMDERDVSMHADFKDELRDLLGAAGLALPRVFVPGEAVVEGQPHIDLGSADDVRALHEAGELAPALAGCEPLASRVHLAPPCAGCGDMRFLPCETCYGSCKLFASDEGGHLDDMFGRCPDCNENGLIRCQVCYYC